MESCIDRSGGIGFCNNREFMSKAAARLKAINREAKKIREKHPRMSYQSAQKEAGKKFRSGRITGAKKKKAPAKRKASHKPRRMSGMEATYSQKRSDFHRSAKEELGWLLATQRTASTKKEKKALQPRINALTRTIKSLK